MSINSNIKPYVLKRFAKTYDELGSPVNDWAIVETIDVSVNYNHTSKIINDIIYKVVTPTAITDYNAFNLKDKYRLDGNVHIFDIESINQEGRKTLLILKEVF